MNILSQHQILSKEMQSKHNLISSHPASGL